MFLGTMKSLMSESCLLMSESCLINVRLMDLHVIHFNIILYYEIA